MSKDVGEAATTDAAPSKVPCFVEALEPSARERTGARRHEHFRDRTERKTPADTTHHGPIRAPLPSARVRPTCRGVSRPEGSSPPCYVPVSTAHIRGRPGVRCAFRDGQGGRCQRPCAAPAPGVWAFGRDRPVRGSRRVRNRGKRCGQLRWIDCRSPLLLGPDPRRLLLPTAPVFPKAPFLRSGLFYRSNED